MPNSFGAWLERAEKVLSSGVPGSEEIQFATSLLTAVYGPQSPQLNAYTTTLAQIAKASTSPNNAIFHQGQHARGVIRNVVGEIQSGLTGSLRAQIAGEVLAELISLGKEILDNDTESSKNVAAVLIAAAFEDLMRRMGSEMAGVIGRPKLEEVISGLKTAGILKGGEVAIAQSYLKFRNDSLHADWANVQKSQIQSCIAFIEVLLVKHFS